MNPTPTGENVEVPFDQLAPETLRRVLEEYVSREGTDYGDGDFTMDGKCAAVLRQLRKGEAIIVFDLATETMDIVSRR